MSKDQFVQRRDGRVAALQYLYAWSLNTPADLQEDLQVFFEGRDQARDHYAFGEELIHGSSNIRTKSTERFGAWRKTGV